MINILEETNLSQDFKGYDLLQSLLLENGEFSQLIIQNILSGKIRFFGEIEWSKIKNQNFVSLINDMSDFEDMFKLGYNIGNCVGTSRQLSFSYNNVDIVSGTLPILKGTLNAEKEGGHCWLETPSEIIDTTFLLVIDKSLKNEIGYHEEQRLTSDQLKFRKMYQSRKEFTNDPNIRK